MVESTFSEIKTSSGNVKGPEEYNPLRRWMYGVELTKKYV